MLGLLKIFVTVGCLYGAITPSLQDIVLPKEPPHINFTHSETVVSSGNNFTLICSAKEPITWVYPENQETESAEESIKIVRVTEFPDAEYPFGLMLEIIGILPVDVGYYTCVYNQTDNLQADRDKLEILEKEGKAKSIYVFVEDPETLMVPGPAVMHGKQYSNVTFPCRPTAPNVDVELFIKEGNTPFKVNESVSYDPHLGFTVFIKSVLDNSYTCIATRGSTVNETDIFLNIISFTTTVAKPSIVDFYDGNTVIGSELNLECNVRIDPGIQFNLQWYLPNPETKNDDRLNISPTTVGPFVGKSSIHQKLGKIKLTLKNVTKEDEGIYKCEITDANENVNIAEKKIIVRNVGESSIDLIESAGLYEITTKVGKMAKWIITIKAFPPPNITWYDSHNNIITAPFTLPHVAKIEVKTDPINPKHTSLFLMDPQFSDAGVYRVRASNQYQTKELNLTLTVEGPPKTFLESDKYYLDGTNATVHCKVNSFPLPNITWYFVDCINEEQCPGTFKQEIPKSLYTYTANGYTAESVVTVHANKSGHVMCVGRNKENSSSSLGAFYLSEVKDGFGVEGNSGMIAEGDNVTLTCILSVYENIIGPVHWYKGNEEVFMSTDEVAGFYVTRYNTSFSNKVSLEIPNVKLSHSDTYTCRAGDSEIDEVYEERVTLDVKEVVIPYITETNLNNSDLYLRLGDMNRHFDCFAEGMPVPEIKWFKDNVELEAESKGGTTSIKNIGTNGRRLFFKFINFEDRGEYRCRAFSRVGSTSRYVNIKIASNDYKDIYIGSIAALVIVFIILIAYLIWKIRREKEIRKKLSLAGLLNFAEGDTQCLNPELGVDEQAELLPYDKKWEFPRERLKLGPQLGSGAFGIVVKAKAFNLVEGEDSTTVAVKMVKKTADATYIKALASELKIMVHLGKHLNVVNLLGACTNNVSKRELLVIVEYCRFGNIHNYLLRHRGNYIDQVVPGTNAIDISIGPEHINRGFSVSSNRSGTGKNESEDSAFGTEPLHSPNMDTNNTMISMVPGSGDVDNVVSNGSVQPEWRSNYRGDYNYNKDIKPMTTQDLICWSFQVARGMEYLSSRKVLHGDLAARNILLADNNIVKICDFGLAKNMYKDDNYKKKGDGPLPIKWMAIESIRDRVFSTQSDVWSYGIVLWEMFSLAKTPYPGIEANEKFYNKLIKGYRMEKPEYATKHIYQIMLECWRSQPIHRPSFGELAEKFGNLLEDGVRSHYIDLNEPYMQMNNKWIAERGDNDYLAMLSAPDYGNLVSASKHHYENDPFGGPTRVNPVSPDETDDEGYLKMIPNENGVISHESPVFNFNIPVPRSDPTNDQTEVELIPMLKLENEKQRLSSVSDVSDTYPRSPKTPMSPNTINILNSFSNPSYQPMFKLDAPIKEEEVVVEDIPTNEENYVKMSQKDSGFIDTADESSPNYSSYVTMTGNKKNIPLYNNLPPTTTVV